MNSSQALKKYYIASIIFLQKQKFHYHEKIIGSLKIFVELGFPCKNPSSKVLKISHIESKSFDGSQKVVRTFNDTI